MIAYISRTAGLNARGLVGFGVLLALLSGCDGGGSPSSPSQTAPSERASASPVESLPLATATPPPLAVSPTAAAPTPTLLPTTLPSEPPAATARPAAVEPRGFPIDPTTQLGLVVGATRARTISWGAGRAALPYSTEDQVSNDPIRANASGWDCRLHVEYEGAPAVDWYLPTGTPVVATMDGSATLNVTTTTNAFDYWSVSREPYLGNPDRGRAPLSPFPGPGGGKGVFVRVTNARFVTEYAHLDLAGTLGALPEGALLPAFSRATIGAQFAPMRDYRESTLIARWDVRRGDMLGFSGDAGYSEAPHLHYTVAPVGGGNVCPTSESGFPNGAWLER